MQKTMKFKGMKAVITRDRIAETDREEGKHYYEFVSDNEQPFLPIMIVEEAEEHFWGTMILEDEFEMNNGEFHSLQVDLGMKLAKGFGLAD